MTPERWARVEQLYARAGLLPADEWPLFLAGEAGDDIELVDVVLQMLRTRASRDFIEPPATGGAPRPPPTGDAWIGKKLGDCEIVALLGKGGMGLVFRARQAALKRDVALKILPFQSMSRASHVARFEKEARIAAQLNHKNVVKIHDVRVDGDVRWFTMELVEGPDLGKEIVRLKAKGAAPADAKGAHLPPFESREYVAKVVALVAQAADALESAHRAGVIHRDIKPGNLLIDSAGDVRIVDFGLARHDERDERGEDVPALTKSGDALGTPHYMSPEQVRRKAHHVDGRTDVWSLGVVLYELLSLEKPFDGGTDVEVARKITHEEPEPLRKLAPRVPKDLAVVCATAMSREPRDRYSSAGNFRDDLRRFLAHEAIVARPMPLARQAGRYVVRHRVPFIAAAAAVVAIAGSAIWHAMSERQRLIDDEVASYRDALAMEDFEGDPAKVVAAAERLEVRERDLSALDDEERAVALQFRQRLTDDAANRVAKSLGLYNAGKADRSDPQRSGVFRSGASEREISEAQTYSARARAIHPKNLEIARLAQVEAGFPLLSIRLADETKAAPRAAEARAWALPIDDVLDEVGPARELGPVPTRDDIPIPPGHWRIVVEIPDWGISEHSHYLIPSILPYSIVARVLPAAQLEAGMKRIEGGVFKFRNDGSSKLGCGKVLEEATYDTYWIDEAELSNRELVEFLEGSGAAPPQVWKHLGCEGRDWRTLPIGDLGDRWLDLPAVMLTSAEATACAEWRGKRLPTHVELERAIRGAAAWFHPWNEGDRSDAGGRCNIDGQREKWRDLAEYWAFYLRNVLPTRAEGYRQQPEGLFHAYGNVTELTDTFLVEETEGRLITFPWERLNLGASWDAASQPHSMAMHAHSGATFAYIRNDIGVRLARSAAAPKGSSKDR